LGCDEDNGDDVDDTGCVCARPSLNLKWTVQRTSWRRPSCPTSLILQKHADKSLGKFLVMSSTVVCNVHKHTGVGYWSLGQWFRPGHGSMCPTRYWTRCIPVQTKLQGSSWFFSLVVLGTDTCSGMPITGT